MRWTAPHLPAYDSQILRQELFAADAPRTLLHHTRGVSMLGISDAAESIGFRTSEVRITLKQLEEDVPLPCILHWNQNHFVVCYDIRKKKERIQVPYSRPRLAERHIHRTGDEEVLAGDKDGRGRKGNGTRPGAAPEFYEQGRRKKEKDGKNSLSFFFKYLLPYKRQIAHLLLGMLAVSLLQLIFPFLTQSLVDVGIRDGTWALSR